jgi:hypothetical protein
MLRKVRLFSQGHIASKRQSSHGALATQEAEIRKLEASLGK